VSHASVEATLRALAAHLENPDTDAIDSLTRRKGLLGDGISIGI